jgi:ABC-type branched-subunit amino acid transport system ATPase component/ABC-type branched-subunit amino acid transport system permease subunit
LLPPGVGPRGRYLIAAIVILVLPWLPVSDFVVHLAQTFAYTAIAVIGLNLLLGMTGQMSLGQAGFYALGAYGSALTALKLGWPLWLSVPFGVLVASVFGMVVGVFALRTRGLYLAMTTLAVGFVIDILAQRWVNLTGGTMGLMAIPQIDFGDLARGSVWYLYVAGACLLLVQVISHYVADSWIGRSMRALRESETFALSVGIRVPRWRSATFAISAAMAGLGGALFAHQSGFIGSDAFTVRLSIALLIAAVIGGLGSRSGPLLGTALLLLIVETIAGLEKYGLIVYGAILLTVLLAFPKGAAGLVDWLVAHTRLRATVEPPALAPSGGVGKVLAAGLRGCELVIDSVTKRYAGVLAVDAVSVTVRAGTVHGLIGPNGAGKSTLINVIAGLYRADSGYVLLDGRDIGMLSPPERARLGVARTFQNLQLIEGATVAENVMLGFAPRRSVLQDFRAWWLGRGFEAEERSEALAILRFLGIESQADKAPAELSYGHRKLVELARAIAQRPRLMLLDEPIAGLNTAEAREIADVVRQLRSLGVTILLVEHNMEFVMSLCDTVSVLDHGELIATGAPNEVQNDERVIDAYLGTKEAA